MSQWTPYADWVLNAASRLNEVITVMWQISYVAFVVFSSYVADYPSSFLPPPSSTGCPMTEGLHPPFDPWGSSGSMVQPGYSPMLGNSPHLSQHGPFTAINPQDRLVSSALTLWIYLSMKIEWGPWHVFNASLKACLVVHLNNLVPFLPRNGNHSLRKTTPYMAVKSTGHILQVSTPAQAALESPATHHLLLALRPLWVNY